MKLIKNNYKIKCEMGACRNDADYVLTVDRVGIHSNFCLCGECAKKIRDAVDEVLCGKEAGDEPVVPDHVDSEQIFSGTKPEKSLSKTVKNGGRKVNAR